MNLIHLFLCLIFFVANSPKKYFKFFKLQILVTNRSFHAGSCLNITVFMNLIHLSKKVPDQQSICWPLSNQYLPTSLAVYNVTSTSKRSTTSPASITARAGDKRNMNPELLKSCTMSYRKNLHNCEDGVLEPNGVDASLPLRHRRVNVDVARLGPQPHRRLYTRHLNTDQIFKTQLWEAVLRIHDIFVRIRIQKAQKHTDPTDSNPDQQHWWDDLHLR